MWPSGTCKFFRASCRCWWSYSSVILLLELVQLVLLLASTGPGAGAAGITGPGAGASSTAPVANPRSTLLSPAGAGGGASSSAASGSCTRNTTLRFSTSDDVYGRKASTKGEDDC